MSMPESKPKTEAAMPCFDCETGTLVREHRNHPLQHPRLGDFSIPAVPVWVCDSCGGQVIGDEGNRLIDAYLDQALNERPRVRFDNA